MVLWACGGRAKDRVDGPDSSSPGTGGALGSGGATGGVSGSGGNSGSGGSPSIDPGSACAEFTARLGDCGGTEDSCPFVSEVTACEFDCIERMSCILVDDDAEDPAERWGYAGCFERCAEEFFCEADGKTVPPQTLCDGQEDCSDGADEADENCGLFDNLFECGEIELPRRQICDGTQDCDDGSDEETCPGFLCHDGSAIIPEAQYCDGKPGDCADDSDESCVTQ